MVFEVIVHLVEIACLQAVNLHHDTAAPAQCGKQVGLLADGDGAFQALEVAFADQLEEGPGRELVEHVPPYLELLAVDFRHMRRKGTGAFKCFREYFCYFRIVSYRKVYILALPSNSNSVGET